MQGWSYLVKPLLVSLLQLWAQGWWLPRVCVLYKLASYKMVMTSILPLCSILQWWQFYLQFTLIYLRIHAYHFYQARWTQKPILSYTRFTLFFGNSLNLHKLYRSETITLSQPARRRTSSVGMGRRGKSILRPKDMKPLASITGQVQVSEQKPWRLESSRRHL